MPHERDEARLPQAPVTAEPVAPEPEEPVRELASTVGNQAFARAITDEGAGIMPDGTVHPDVQRTIDARRGLGSPLRESDQRRYSDSLGDMSDVRVHADAAADTLARSVSARAFAVGTDVYFARDEYRPGSSDGDRLLAHELAHVAQQRGAPSTGAMAVSQPGDAQEREADRAADTMTGP